MAEQGPIQCPQCGSTLTWKDGLRYTLKGRAIQRYLCRNCGHRFSETSLNGKPSSKSEKQNRTANYWRGPLTLEAELEKREAGATEKAKENELQSKIIELLWWMKKQGCKETTIRGRARDYRYF